MNPELNPEPTPDDDHIEATAALVADLFRHGDPVPDTVVQGALAAWTWRTVDDELAALVADSNEGLVGAVAVRSVADSGPRLLSFDGDQLGIELEVSDAPAGGVRIVGQIVPPQGATVTITGPAGTTVADTDDLGSFVVDHVGRGLTRVHIADHAGRRTVTSWVTLT